MAGCAELPSSPTVSSSESVAVPKQLRARQIIVTLAPASPEEWAEQTAGLVRDYGLQQAGAFPLKSLGVQCVVFQVPDDQDLEAVVLRVMADTRVESVQPNQVFEGMAERTTVPYNDPYASLQHGALAIRADAAHAVATGKGVKVAIVDTGVETDHPDLQGRIVQTQNFVEGGEQSFRQDRHGTAVAGVIGAKPNNQLGIFGVAPDAELLVAKACWHREPTVPQALCSSWTLAKALDFSFLAGAQVVNLSLGGPQDALLARLLLKLATHGTIVVAAGLDGLGGNVGMDLGFPASHEAVIGVVSGNRDGRPRSTEWGKRQAPLIAPGQEIVTTVPKQAYDVLSGSSLAAAHVTGAIALLLEHHPRLTSGQAYTLLQRTVRTGEGHGLTPSSERAGGIIDVCAALNDLLHRQACR
jgi:subtilisin family serine protease